MDFNPVTSVTILNVHVQNTRVHIRLYKKDIAMYDGQPSAVPI
jgi:hypothetical protein